MRNHNDTDKIIEAGVHIAFREFGFDPKILIQMSMFPSDFFECVPKKWIGPDSFLMRDAGTHSGFVFNIKTGKAKIIKSRGYWSKEELKFYRKNAKKNYETFLKVCS